MRLFGVEGRSLLVSLLLFVLWCLGLGRQLLGGGKGGGGFVFPLHVMAGKVANERTSLIENGTKEAEAKLTFSWGEFKRFLSFVGPGFIVAVYEK